MVARGTGTRARDVTLIAPYLAYMRRTAPLRGEVISQK